MKTNIKKIIDYYDNRMSGAERIEFEKELKSSSLLRQETAGFEKLHELIKETGDIKADSFYFGSVIPHFRSKNLKRRTYHVPRFVYAFAVSAAAFIITFSFWRAPEVIQTDLDVDTYLNIYPLSTAEYYIPKEYMDDADSLLNNEISNMLMADADKEYLYNDDYHTILAGISETEADLVYEELISKELVY